VIDLLFDLQRGHGTTLVLITHDPGLAARCARTVHLIDGRIVDPDPEPDPNPNGDAGS
jgi:putative ABC transport system ATP-binding protein